MGLDGNGRIWNLIEATILTGPFKVEDILVHAVSTIPFNTPLQFMWQSSFDRYQQYSGSFLCDLNLGPGLSNQIIYSIA